MNTIGQNVKITITGESHSDFMSLVIEGLPIGLRLDETLIQTQLAKRRPHDELTTARVENDHYQITTGLFAGSTTGGPVTIVVPNENVRKEDYQNLASIPRPGHADYPAMIKYPDFMKKTGGGMFSGRMTVLYVIIGSIAKQILNGKGIFVGSHIAQIHNIKDRLFKPEIIKRALIDRLEAADFPLLDDSKEPLMRAEVLQAKAADDSVGGIVETAIIGLPVGVGEPLFDSVESVLSHLLFSIPAVKGVEFGDGFSFVKTPGSVVSDGYFYNAKGKIVTFTNHNGGLLGGLSTGMPVVLRTVIKPTSSIGILQKSVNLKTKAPVSITVSGRHDPCITIRGVHIVNATVYFGILDLVLGLEASKARK
ncbi:MAG: chorismate synthase [Candidatus Izemoplasmatales bacterium]|nr:chorismate synthase [Candidatus Izemoplasmatales bacterium]MDD3865471.1 chorismate synthase [Candidatus Izemoplasmatales bacterium]